MSATSVLKVWHANRLKPHLTEAFKISRDTQFVENPEDIVGLYLTPPEQWDEGPGARGYGAS